MNKRIAVWIVLSIVLLCGNTMSCCAVVPYDKVLQSPLGKWIEGMHWAYYDIIKCIKKRGATLSSRPVE